MKNIANNANSSDHAHAIKTVPSPLNSPPKSQHLDHCHKTFSLRDNLSRGAWNCLAKTLGFATRHRTQISPASFPVWGFDADDAAIFDDLEVLAATADYRLIRVDDHSGGGDYRTLRRLMCALRRVNPEELVLWWWTRADTLTIALLDTHPDGREFVRRMDINRHQPDAVSLAQLEASSIEDLRAENDADCDLPDRSAMLRRHLADTLAQERLTREFFAGFTRALDTLCTEMTDGPAEPEDRHDIALATLLRLVFLYFLQIRGALDGDQRFVLRKLRQTRVGQKNFYRNALRPLFFDALNQPHTSRQPQVAELGEFPFLNGGLFEPLPAEKCHPDLCWPDIVWEQIIERLLEHYHFAVEEMEGADEQRAIDPEMLGRVFEGLMYGASRQKSGSFYTPRDIVRKLVDEAIGGHLRDTTALGDAQIQAMLAGQSPQLDSTLREEVMAALSGVRILDPAVGTGAFLLEALQVLRRCHRALGQAENTQLVADPLAEYHHVRGLIHSHLFGVDIQHTAVRLCELRLWLSLLTTLPRMPIESLPPLPNLSHKICVGNSLLSPADLLNLRSGRSTFASNTDLLTQQKDGQTLRDLLTELANMQHTYLTAHGAPKLKVRENLAALEAKIQHTMLAARRTKLIARLEPFTQLSASQNLFGDAVELTQSQKDEHDDLRAQLDAIDAAIDALKAGRQSSLSFDYTTRFGQLLEDGGFDIIITNPPWVRAQNIDAAHADVLRKRYACQRRGLWAGAKKAGIRAPFGPQVDLSALFLERSLELLRPGGRLCGLVPAKLFRSLHGSALRAQLAKHTIVALEDFSDGTRRIFDATVYPAMLHLKKRETPGKPVEPARQKNARSRANLRRKPRAAAPIKLTMWRGDSATCWRSQTPAIFAAPGQPGAPWLLARPRILSLFERMRSVSETLGEVPNLQPMRGLFTGCNDVFIHNIAETKELLGEDFDTFSRPVLSGRDVRPWSINSDRRILWGYGDDVELHSDLPDALRTHFDKHTRKLKKRSDYRSDKALWQMFRVKPELTQPKVVWRDLSPKLEAALAPADVVPLNTVYFIALQDTRRARLFAALLNSAPMRAMAFALAERARGGWRRHFAWVMRLLPMPRRFVDFINGREDVELLAFERALRNQPDLPGATRRLDQFTGELFGLTPDEVDYLRRWRCGQEVA